MLVINNEGNLKNSNMAKIGEMHKWVMINFMREHPALLAGRVDNSNCDSQSALWDLKVAFADVVNHAGQVHLDKDPVQAMKSFTDWKRIVFGKTSKAVAHARGTGGGEPLFTHFRQVDQALLNLLGPEAYSMPSIMEGGFQLPQYSSTQGNTFHKAQKSTRRSNEKSSRTNVSIFSSVHQHPCTQISAQSYRSSTIHAPEAASTRGFPQLSQSPIPRSPFPQLSQSPVPRKILQNKIVNYSMPTEAFRQFPETDAHLASFSRTIMNAKNKWPETYDCSTSSRMSETDNDPITRSPAFSPDDDHVAFNMFKPLNNHSKPMMNTSWKLPQTAINKPLTSSRRSETGDDLCSGDGDDFVPFNSFKPASNNSKPINNGAFKLPQTPIGLTSSRRSDTDDDLCAGDADDLVGCHMAKPPSNNSKEMMDGSFKLPQTSTNITSSRRSGTGNDLCSGDAGGFGASNRSKPPSNNSKKMMNGSFKLPQTAIGLTNSRRNDTGDDLYSGGVDDFVTSNIPEPLSTNNNQSISDYDPECMSEFSRNLSPRNLSSICPQQTPPYVSLGELDDEAPEDASGVLDPEEEVDGAMSMERADQVAKSYESKGSSAPGNTEQNRRRKSELADDTGSLLERKFKLQREEFEAQKAQYELNYELRVDIFEFEKEKFEIEGNRHQQLLQTMDLMNDNLVNLLKR